MLLFTSLGKNDIEVDTVAEIVRLPTSNEIDNELVILHTTGALMSECLGKPVLDTGLTDYFTAVSWIPFISRSCLRISSRGYVGRQSVK